MDLDFEIIKQKSYLFDWCIHTTKCGFKYHTCKPVNKLHTINSHLKCNCRCM